MRRLCARMEQAVDSLGRPYMADSPLNAALRHFEAAEANLNKAEKVLSEIESGIPDGIHFGSNADYEINSKSFASLLAASHRYYVQTKGAPGWLDTAPALEQDKKRGHSKFLLLFSVALVVLGLRSNQAEPQCEKPNQLNHRAFLD